MYIEIEAHQVIDMANKAIAAIEQARERAVGMGHDYSDFLYSMKRYGRCKSLRSAARLASPYAKVWVSDEDIIHLKGGDL